MVEIGGKPILWLYYENVLCAWYQVLVSAPMVIRNVIKEYFANYFLHYVRCNIPYG